MEHGLPEAMPLFQSSPSMARERVVLPINAPWVNKSKKILDNIHFENPESVCSATIRISGVGFSVWDKKRNVFMTPHPIEDDDTYKQLAHLMPPMPPACTAPWTLLLHALPYSNIQLTYQLVDEAILPRLVGDIAEMNDEQISFVKKTPAFRWSWGVFYDQGTLSWRPTAECKHHVELCRAPCRHFQSE